MGKLIKIFSLFPVLDEDQELRDFLIVLEYPYTIDFLNEFTPYSIVIYEWVVDNCSCSRKVM